MLYQIRQLFSDGKARDRDVALDHVARVLGYKRLGLRVRDVLNTDLLTAVRRGIVMNHGDGLILYNARIVDYKREALKKLFLASLGGSIWTEREDAIRKFARWLGFRRTGPAINESARSIINGLLRENRLESDGDRIRRV